MTGRGSSPLARGLHADGAVIGCDGRIIPARAGFTGLRRHAGRGTADHPRSRGVYGGVVERDLCEFGSSPLARGLLLGSGGRPRLVRIIPARAGFTPIPLSIALRRSDHPRSRGVYFTPVRDGYVVVGSSPLARGLPVGLTVRIVARGIIPARAGFTEPQRFRVPRCADHPRSRGVYRNARSPGPAIRGSSPLARGLHARLHIRSGVGGIIPARAGFTDSAVPRRGGPRDHPRSRGVYLISAPPRERGSGSSPLARGLPSASDWYSLDKQDHPRSRGVYHV